MTATETRDLGSLLTQFLKNKLDNDNTRRTYRSGLLKFFGWIQEREGRRPLLADMTRDNIIAFRDSELQRFSPQTGRLVSTNTVTLNLVAINKFDEALAEHYKRPRAFVAITMPDVKKPPLHGLKDAEFRKIMRHLLKAPKKHIHQRTKLTFILGIETALRRNEMARIRLGQLDREALLFRSVYISKNHPPADKVITSVLLEAIDEYLPYRAKVLQRRKVDALDPRVPLLVAHSKRGNTPDALQMTGESIHRCLFQLGKKCGVHLHPHKCRHTAARQHLDAGNDIRFVADLLGHKNLNTTMGYTAETTESRKRGLDKRAKHVADVLAEVG